MGECIKTAVQVALAILPVICIIIYTVSIVTITISLNPDVKWNEYIGNASDGFNEHVGYYYNTLWSSFDASVHEQRYQGSYIQILRVLNLGIWKIHVRNDFYTAIGLGSGAVVSLALSLAVNAVTKEKFFTTFFMIVSCGNGISAGYFTITAIDKFKLGFPTDISLQATNYYSQDKDEMKLGYHLASNSAIIVLVSSGILFINIGLYIGFGEGKWICHKMKKDTKQAVKDTDVSDISTSNFISRRKRNIRPKIHTIVQSKLPRKPKKVWSPVF